ISEANQLIDWLNLQIASHNEKVRNRARSMADIKNRFWSLMRWDYDATLASWLSQQAAYSQKVDDAIRERDSTKEQIQGVLREVQQQQSKTVNIDTAIEMING